MDDPFDRELLSEIDAVERRGPRGRHHLVRLMLRGDWRARAMALSAAGVLVRNDPTAFRRWSVSGRVLARIPRLRRHIASVGERGLLLGRSVANGLFDRCFVVRTAAALALGECRDARHADRLRRLLSDPFRGARLAAAAALAACGQPVSTSELLVGTDPTPAELGDGAATLAWLELLATRHRTLLAACGVPGAPAAQAVPFAWAEWLAGALAVTSRGGVAAEVARYAGEADLAYQVAKPFGAEDRDENLQQLDAFVTVAAHLDVPRGAWVLDLGGGSGWVSEFLARFGIRAVTLDVSQTLLRLARRRLRQASLPSRTVAGDMSALPFGGGRFAAAVVIDALHHVSDMEAVLREVKRILEPGGRLLVAEPGEGHAESEKSRAEAREQGVHEGEVHPFAIERAARRAGFDRVDLVAQVPRGATLAPAALRRAMREPTERWEVQHRGDRTSFDALVLQTMLGRPVVVLSVGERLPDTRSPGRLRASIDPRLERHGRRLEGVVELRNEGDTLWLPSSTEGPGGVWLGLQLLGPDGRMLDRELGRAPLEAAVPPGGEAHVTVAVELPTAAGGGRLKLDLVAERICWFEDRDSRPAIVDLEGRP